MAVCFSRISYLSFGTEIAKCKWQSLQPYILNRKQSEKKKGQDKTLDDHLASCENIDCI